MNEHLTEILSNIKKRAESEVFPKLKTLIASRENAGKAGQEKSLIRLKALLETMMGWSFRTLEKVIPIRNLPPAVEEEEEVASDEELENQPEAPSDGVEVFEVGDEKRYIASAHRWRWIAIAEGVALIVTMVGLVFVAGADRLVPYVVEIGPGGATFAAHSARQASMISQDVVRGQLANFIVNARSIVSDNVIQKRYVDGVYGIVTGGAKDYIGGWYSTPGQSPFELEQHETREVEIVYVKPIAPPSYEISWTETIRASGKDSQVHDAVETWEATLSIAFRSQSDEGSILSNPLGMYVTALNWQKKL